jgi:hypothetical protein
MSRGHGRIQLQVLDFLLRYDEATRARGSDDVYVTIVEIAGVGASRSRVESVRRAAKSLADEGLIMLSSDDSQRSTGGDRRMGPVRPSSGLAARLASQEAERGSAGERRGDREMSA